MPRACWNCSPLSHCNPPCHIHTLSTPPGLPTQTTGSAYHRSPLLFWKVACVCLVTARVSCPLPTPHPPFLKCKHTLTQTDTRTHPHTPCLCSVWPVNRRLVVAARDGWWPRLPPHSPPCYTVPYIPQCLIYKPAKKDRRKDGGQKVFWWCGPLVTSGLWAPRERLEGCFSTEGRWRVHIM